MDESILNFLKEEKLKLVDLKKQKKEALKKRLSSGRFSKIKDLLLEISNINASIKTLSEIIKDYE